MNASKTLILSLFIGQFVCAMNAQEALRFLVIPALLAARDPQIVVAGNHQQTAFQEIKTNAKASQKHTPKHQPVRTINSYKKPNR